MADKIIAKLREENEFLLQKLKKGVKELKIHNSEKEKQCNSDVEILGPETRTIRARNQLKFGTDVNDNRGPNNNRARPVIPQPARISSLVGQPEYFSSTPSARPKRLQRRSMHKNEDAAITSTPMNIQQNILESEGNIRKSAIKHSSRKSSCKKLAGPRSILVTPDSRKAPKMSRQKVTFPASINDQETERENDVTFEKSMLGYDWIAGMLDNDSSMTEEPDNFFEEIKEFRRVNRAECINSRTVVDSRIPDQQITPRKAENILESDSTCETKTDICCGSTYTINNRLLPVPIHGPYSQCPVCHTKPESETEYEKSYVRVSVPRSSLKSPYRLKPRRRRSFDPSDSIALSEHCLAGWQCARPAYAPGPDSLDLKSSMKVKDELRLPKKLTKKTSNGRTTEELLNTTIGMRYGLQLLENRENIPRRANSTLYPAF